MRVKHASRLVRWGSVLVIAGALSVPTASLAAGTVKSEDVPKLDASSDGNVTVIVQLNDGGWFRSLRNFVLGDDTAERHENLKSQIEELAKKADQARDDAAKAQKSDADQAAQLASLEADEAASAGGSSDAASSDAAAADEPAFTEVQDYYHAFDGFAVEIPASTLDDIKQLDGVEHAFIEQVYEVPTDEASTTGATETAASDASAPKNENALKATGADEVEYTGKGQTIAIIDTGLDTDHEAFSGKVSGAALSKSDVENLRGQLTAGKDAQYVDEKIPFAYDYADGDANVNPGGAGMEHGTHVAGIAAANGGQIRGTAPDAQILAMKVATDNGGGMPDSAILAALDDVAVLKPDSVNISLGRDAGFGDEGEPTYTAVMSKLEAEGVTVNVAAGNSYSYGLSNQSGQNKPYAEDPDNAIISTPASVSSSLAVASVGSDPVEVAEKPEAAGSTLTAADGTKLSYVELTDPDGQQMVNRWSGLADGTYEYVYAGIARSNGDYEGQDYDGDINGDWSKLKGKVAVVKGNGYFLFEDNKYGYSQMVTQCQSAGAVGVIIVDDRYAEPQPVSFDKDNGYWDAYDGANFIPTILVGYEQGQALIGAATKTVTKAAAASAATSTTVTAADGTKLSYDPVTGPDGSAVVNKFDDLPEGTYDYIWGGIGRDDDHDDSTGSTSGILDENGDVENGQDLTGKIVIVEGNAEWIYGIVIDYARAANYYKSMGAAAVIFYDPGHTTGQRAEFRDDTGYYNDGHDVAPAIMVTPEEGAALKAAATKTVTISHAAEKPATKSYYQMSAYSSWGVTPDLKLKPEVATPGGNVYSSIPNGGYAYYSGTSMATPQMAGIAAQLTQYIEGDAKFKGLSDAEREALVTQLAMSTAKPMADTDDLSSYYSPRHQGAGLVNVPAATTTEVYATVEDATNESRPKADLGESSDGTWSFTVKLHNLGEGEHAFTFDGAALSDTVADGLFQLQSKNWTGEGIDISASESKVTVPAHGTASVTVTVKVGDAFASWAKANTPKGTFVDGFAMFKSADKGVDLSVPYVGFYGDWSAANVFDKDVSDSYHSFGTSLIDASTGEYLGVNPLDESAARDASKVDMSKIVISNSPYAYAPNKVGTQTGLLRNAAKLVYDITYNDLVDENGKPVSGGTKTYTYVPKTYWNANAKAWAYAETLMGESPVVAATDTDVSFTFKETATTDGPTPEEQSIEHTVHVDNTAPVITDAAYSSEGADGAGEPTLTFTVEDNTYVAAIDFVDPEVTGVTPYNGFKRVLVGDDNLVKTKDDGTHVYRVTVKVSDIKGAWNAGGQIPNVVHAYAWDYGMNPTSQATDAVVNPIAATGVSIDGGDVELAPHQEVPLTATLTPADTTETKLTWSVADDKVATVSADGTLTGVKEGETTATVRVKDRPEVTATVAVRVAAVGSDEGIRTSAARKRVVSEGGTVDVSALLSTDLAGKQVTWKSSDEGVVTVKASKDDSSKATITGGYQVADATVTASVTAEDGTVRTASMTVENRTADYDDFVIEDGVVTKYIGTKSSISIPNDVTEVADRFIEGNAVIEAVKVPASVRRIGERSFAKIKVDSESSTTITGATKTIEFEDTKEHPSQLEEIGSNAFANGGVGGKVVLPDSVTKMGTGVFQGNLAVTWAHLPKSLTEVPDYTFDQAASLQYAEMSDDVTRVGTSAFKNDLFLTDIGIIGRAHEDGVILLPSKLTELGDSAFAAGYLGGWVDSDGVSRGSKVTIPAGVKRIESSAFSMNTYITEVEIEEGVEEVGQNAFYQTSVASLTLPDSVTKLDWHAFAGMYRLKEITLGKNLGAGEFAGTVGSYLNGMVGVSSMALERVNVPADSRNYASYEGGVYSKDMKTLEYYPAMLTGKNGVLTVPAGVTRIAEGALDDAHISQLVLPDSLEVVERRSLTKQFGTLDFGKNVTKIDAEAFRQTFYSDDSGNAGYTPNHLIVRGGHDGSYADTGNARDQRTAYFGPGMTSLDFSRSGAPATLVVPADLASLDLSGNAGNPGAVTVYAPEGSAGWNVAKAALESIGANASSQLKPYVQLAAKASATEGENGAVTVEASHEGGVGGVWYRFVQVGADGAQKVLQDWGAKSSYTWSKPAAGDASLRVEARDTTELTAGTMALGPAAPVFTRNLPAEPVQLDLNAASPVLSVEVAPVEGVELSYQWYRDGKKIDGATASAYAPATDEVSTHVYQVVVTAAKDGLSVSAQSAKVTVMVGTSAQAPVIETDLAATQTVEAGGELTLEVKAKSVDGGALTYQWFRDGEPLAGATGASYEVDTTELGTHAYQVRVVNTLTADGVTTTAEALSATSRVTVAEVPDPAGTSDALKTFVDRVDGLTQDQYEPESWEAFATALAAAQKVAADATATQPVVNAALSDLQMAYRGLEKKAQEGTMIPDGTYDIGVSTRNASSVDAESMSSPLFGTKAALVVKDGKATVEVTVNQGASIMGLTAYASDFYYYLDGYTLSGGAIKGVGTPSAAEVLATDAKGRPTRISLALGDQARTEGYIAASGQFEGMGNMSVAFKLDWQAFNDAYGFGSTAVAKKDELDAAIKRASALTQGEAAKVDWSVLQAALAAARKVRDNAYATQAEVDEQAVALTEACDVFEGVSTFDFSVKGVYDLGASMVDEDGSPLSGGFTSKARVTRTADGYEVTLVMTLPEGARLLGLTVGEGDDAATAKETTTEADQQAGGVQRFTFTLKELAKATKLSYQLKLGDADPVEQAGYLVFDLTAVDVVDESQVVVVDKSALEAAIKEAAAIEQGKKTDEAFSTLQAAIKEASSVADDADATQTDVAIAVRKLKNAVKAFQSSADADDGGQQPGGGDNGGNNGGDNGGQTPGGENNGSTGGGDDTDQGGSDGDQTGADQSGSGGKKANAGKAPLPQTGDDAAWRVIVPAAAGVLAVMVGILRRRRQS